MQEPCVKEMMLKNQALRRECQLANLSFKSTAMKKFSNSLYGKVRRMNE